MAPFVLRRLVQGLLTMWVVVTLSFLLMRAAPGGPFDREKPLPPAVMANLGRTFGLAADLPSPVAGTVLRFVNKVRAQVREGEVLAIVRNAAGAEVTVPAPRDLILVQNVGEPGRKIAIGQTLCVRQTGIFEQYLASLVSYAHLDFGVTYASEGATSVLHNLLVSFPVSLELGVMALILALAFGVTAGFVAALYRNTWIDHVAMTGALGAVSLSSIVLGPLLVLIFGVWLQWLPWGGWEPFSFSWPHLQVKILPVVTLAIVYAGWFARLARAGLLEVIHQDFIRTARAKGLSEFAVVTRHALRGALLPVVSFLGPALAGIVTGSVVVERIFSVPGIGEYFVTAAVNRDYPMVMGTVVLYSCLLILANIGVDIAYAVLDPRVRTEAR